VWRHGTVRRGAVANINGLIDVNSASSSLLLAFLNGIGQSGTIEAINTRRSALPFTSNQEFLSLLNLNPETKERIDSLVTINSGQRRENGQTAPRELLQILSGSNASIVQMIALIDNRFLRTRPITKVAVWVLE